MKEHSELTNRDLLEQIIKNQAKLAQFIERLNKRLDTITNHLGIIEKAYDATYIGNFENLMYSDEILLGDPYLKAEKIRKDKSQ